MRIVYRAIMQSIRPYLDATATVADAEAFIAAHPELTARLNTTTRQHRTNTRMRLRTVYSAEVVAVLVPQVPFGRPKVYVGTWQIITQPVRELIIAQVCAGRDLETLAAADWTPQMAADAADIVVAHYPNSSSAHIALGKLRACLGVVGVAREIIAKTLRPETAKRHNEACELARVARIGVGIEIPECFQRVSDLRDRLEAFVASDPATSVADAATAADMLVALSARPGESETLKIGERGAVQGVLKKKNRENLYNLVSAVGVELAEATLRRWKCAPADQRKAAMLALSPLCASWNLQRRDLRAIGAMLAVRAAVADGRVQNDGQARELHAAALRHDPAPQPAAVNYARVNDPTMAMAARIADLSPAMLAAVEAILTAAGV